MPPSPTSAGPRAAVPTPAAILAGVAQVAREHVGWRGELAPGMRLVEDLRLDSLRLLTLAVEVENRFRVALDEEDEAGIETVGDLVAAIRRKLGARAANADSADAEAGAREADS
jgi:acyl carrier protein